MARTLRITEQPQGSSPVDSREHFFTESCPSLLSRVASHRSAAFQARLLHWHCAGEQWASSYCIRKGLIRKAHLAHNLKKWAAKHPDGLLAASVPETHVMEVDDVDYIDEALADVYEVTADFSPISPPSHVPGL